EVLVLPDLAAQPLTGGPATPLEDVIRGLVAVPIYDDDMQVIGTICVFDLQPLTVTTVEIETLKALGRSLLLRSVGHDQPAKHEETEEKGEDVREPARSAMAIEWPQALLEWTSGEFAVGRELARARREQRQLSVIMFDVSVSDGLPPPDRVFGT